MKKMTSNLKCFGCPSLCSKKFEFYTIQNKWKTLSVFWKLHFCKYPQYRPKSALISSPPHGMIEKVGSYWKWGKNQSWKCENSMYFHMTITFFLFAVQTWPTYEKYSIFHEDSKKQHRVTPKRNKSNKRNTWS